MPRSVVTLTTDFGLSDHYVGVMKGVILNVNPEADLVDICHDIRPYDVLEGAFAIAQSYRYFPQRTIHLVVVDPGVGSARRPLLVAADNHYFIAPDNGVLSLVFSRAEDLLVRHITASHYFLDPISHTFHGRDIFAPVAGWLSRHVEVEKFGDPVTDFVRFTPPQAKRINERLLKGVVLRVDPPDRASDPPGPSRHIRRSETEPRPEPRGPSHLRVGRTLRQRVHAGGPATASDRLRDW